MRAQKKMLTCHFKEKGLSYANLNWPRRTIDYFEQVFVNVSRSQLRFLYLFSGVVWIYWNKKQQTHYSLFTKELTTYSIVILGSRLRHWVDRWRSNVGICKFGIGFLFYIGMWLFTVQVLTDSTYFRRFCLC